MHIAKLIFESPLSLHPPSLLLQLPRNLLLIPLLATTSSPWSFTGPGLLDIISCFNLNIVSHTILSFKINLDNLLTLSDTVEVHLHKDLHKKMLIQG